MQRFKSAPTLKTTTKIYVMSLIYAVAYILLAQAYEISKKTLKLISIDYEFIRIQYRIRIEYVLIFITHIL